MTERKLSKRAYMCVVQGEKGSPTPSYSSGSPIYTMHQTFSMKLKHKKGSNRPEGYFHNAYWGGTDAEVEVRWLFTEEHQYFAPEISFRPTERGMKVASKVAKALHSLRNTSEEGPEALNKLLKATRVRYMTDNKEGCWDDYKPDYSGNAMMVIARAAAGY